MGRYRVKNDHGSEIATSKKAQQDVTNANYLPL